MNSEEHRSVRELLGTYALGGLDQPEHDGVEAHLSGCSACRAELDAIAGLAGPLREVDPQSLATTPVPPEGLAEHVVAGIRDAQPRARRLPPRWAVGAVAAAITAAIMLPAGFLLGPSPPEVPIEPVAVTVLDPAVEAEAEVIPHTWGMEIVLTGEGFDAGEVYTVEVLDEDGDRAGAGEFIGIGEEELVCNLNSSVLQEDVAGFEVRQAEGDVVLSSSL